MIIDVLKIHKDGTQELIQREVSDDYHDAPAPQPSPEDILQSRISDLELAFAALMGGAL